MLAKGVVYFASSEPPYHRLDPAEFPAPAIFRVFSDGDLAAVVREPAEMALIGEPEPFKNYRVDCRDAPNELRTFLAGYFPGSTFKYCADPGWKWNDNGTYQEMPW